MNLTVKIGKRNIACEWAEHRNLLIRGIVRPAIEFTFPAEAINLDALLILVNNPENTQTIVITNNEAFPVIDENGQETGQVYSPTETLTGYTVRSEECITFKSVEVEPATQEHPAIYADKIVLQLGMAFNWEV